MKKTIPFVRFCIAAACSSVFAGAHSQTLDEVVVSVSGQEQSAFDAPAAIQAIDQSVIQNSGPQVNLSESLNRIPGLVVLNRQNYAQDLQLSIRGSGSRAPFGIRGSRLIVDGIPATMPDGQGQASTISLSSAKRIEVLRGPLAQMYGNSSAGVIQVFSVDGTEVPQIKSSIDSGPNGMQRLGLQATGVVNGLGYMIDHSDFKTDGLRRHSAAKRKHTNTKLTTTVFEDTKLSLVGNFFDMPLSQDPRGLTKDELRDDRLQANPDSIKYNAGKEVSQNQIGVVSETKLSATSDLMLRAYVGERDLLNPLATGSTGKLNRSFKGLGFRHNSTHAVGSGAITFSFGAEVEDMKDERKSFDKNRVKTRDEDNIATSQGVFAQANWVVNEDWSVIFGLRANEVKLKVKDYFPTSSDNPDDSGSVKFKSTNPVLGLTRHFSENSNLFFNYGRGFDTPTLLEIFYITIDPIDPTSSDSRLNFALQPAKSDHYEIGYKTRLSKSQRLDVSYFVIDTKNEIIVEANAKGRTVFRNAPRTYKSGIEVAHSAQWNQQLSSYMAFSTLNARFSDSFTSNKGFISKGNHIPGTMDKQFFAELSWKPLSAPSLTTSLELLHQGKIRVNDLNSGTTSGATTYNLRLGWDRQYGSWAVKSYLRVDNITDKKYVGSVIANDNDDRFYEPAPGRQVGVGLSATYSF
jgi:iron complex outermembrane receptor protein